MSEPQAPSLADAVRFLAHRWKILLGVALLAAVVVFVYFRLVVPPRYQAVATLAVVPPTVPGSLRPADLSIQGYDRLIRSSTVLANTRRQLADQGILDAGEDIRLGQELATRILVAPRTEAPLAPTIEVLAIADRPEKAEAIANTWARTFLALGDTMVAQTVEATTELIAQQYQEALAELEEVEEGQLALEEKNAEEIEALVARWDRERERLDRRWQRTLADHRRGTLEAERKYDAETRETMEELVERTGLLREAPSIEIEARLRQVANLRSQLARQSEIVVLTRSTGNEGTGGVEGIGMVWAEEPNPLYAELEGRLSELEATLRGSLDQHPSDRLIDALDALKSFQEARSRGRLARQLERAERIDELSNDRRHELTELRRARERATEESRRAQDRALDRLDRDLRPTRSTFNKLAVFQEEAALAKSGESLSDVRLISPAVAPLSPEPRHAGVKAMVGFFVSALLTLLALVGREIVRRRPREGASEAT